MSSVLIHDSDFGEKSIYFISKVFRGAELRYQKTELLALVVVITAWKPRPYFQSHTIVFKTNYLVK